MRQRRSAGAARYELGDFKGDLDLLIAQHWINAAPPASGLSRAPLLEDVVDVALASTHRLAGRASVALDELADERWISWHPGTTCHDWLVHTLRPLGHTPW